MLIQFHMLQNYAPANLNRDETGSPKDAIFGGVPRGRISSQCLKRSIRKSLIFKQTFEQDGLLGERTKLLPQIIRDELSALGADEQTLNAIVALVPELGRESKKGQAAGTEVEDAEEAAESAEEQTPGKTKQLIFVDRKQEARPLAEKLLETYRQFGDKKWKQAKIPEVAKALGDHLPRSVDIALFGRMTTSQAFRDVHAASQVAHALSTNAVNKEFDYYTAMDDLQPNSEPGAGMIGDIEFNSNTYYKYLNVHWEELLKNLGGDRKIARRAVLALLEAAALAQPTGKQNSFAAFNLPDFVLVEVSDRNLPINYANAFLKPVRENSSQSLMANSIAQLSEYVVRVSKAYNLTPERAYMTVEDGSFLNMPAQPSLDDLKTWLDARLPT